MGGACSVVAQGVIYRLVLGPCRRSIRQAFLPGSFSSLLFFGAFKRRWRKVSKIHESIAFPSRFSVGQTEPRMRGRDEGY